MPSGPLQWQFEIFDKLSPPARQMEKATAGVEKAMARASKATGEMEKGTEKAGNRWTEFAAKMHVVGTAVRGAVGFLEMGARKALDLAGALGKVQSREQSFGLLLGKQGGADVLGYIDRVAQHTQFTRGQLRDMVAPLVAQGFGRKDISRLLPAGLDVGAMFGNDPAAVARALEMFAKVKSTGRIEGEGFKALGLSERDVLGRLGGTSPERMARVKQDIGAGRIGSGALLEALFGAITAKTGGPLGTGGIGAAGSIEAKINKLTNAPGEMLEKFLANPATMERVGKTLDRLLVLVEQFGNVAFPRLLALAEALAAHFDVNGAPRPTSEQGVLGQIIDRTAGIKARVVIGGRTVTFDDKAFGEVLDRAGTGWWGRLWTRMPKQYASLVKQLAREQGIAVGTETGEGYIQGLLAKLAEVQGAGAGMVGAAVEGVKQEGEIRSPSRVFERLGRYTVEGFVQGIGAGERAVAGAYAQAFAPAVPMRSGGATTGGPLSSMQVGDIIVNVGAAPSGTSPQEFAEMVGDAVEARLEEFAAAIGVPS